MQSMRPPEERDKLGRHQLSAPLGHSADLLLGGEGTSISQNAIAQTVPIRLRKPSGFVNRRIGFDSLDRLHAPIR